MRGIALTIFLSFWLIFAVLIASFALLPDFPAGVRFQDHLRAHADIAAQLLDHDGVPGCGTFVAAARDAAGVRLALFDAQAKAVCHAPGDDVTDLQRHAGSRSTSPSDGGDATLITVEAPSGAMLQAVGVALPRFAVDAVVPPFPYRTVAYAIVLSGLVCFAMARYLARPLQLVRDASYRLAAGDLHARAGPAVGRRRDEIGDLVRDFDAMAGRLEALVHAQNQLLSDISHELRSPLARLNVALELARRKTPPEVAGDLNRIETEAERMNELIGRVLSLSRAENDPATVMGPVDLSDIVQHVAADAEYEARRQDTSVEFHAIAAPIVHGHAPLIASAVDNVVRNALRYTLAGSAIVVTLNATDREALITVRDHGPGVPPSELERIFSPFHRVESGRNRETGGVGLGLAIARRAVAVHGGAIAAENATGGGLQVTIRLPLRPSTPSAHKP